MAKNNLTCGGQKAQASIEYLVMLGSLLVVVTVLFMQSQMAAQSQIIDSTALLAVEQIAAAANEAYHLGPGTKLYVTVDIPGNVVGSIVSGNEVGVQVAVPGAGVTDVVKIINGPGIGRIPINKGTYALSVEMLNSGNITIGCNLFPESCPA